MFRHVIYNLLAFFLLSFCQVISHDAISQDTTESVLADTVKISLIKTKIELDNDGHPIFNVATIKNLKNRPIKGRFKISLPTGWNVLGERDIPIDLQPGEEVKLPFRIHYPDNVVGGKSYVMSLGFYENNFNLGSGSFYVKFEELVSFRMEMDVQTIYGSTDKKPREFDYKLMNLGNTSKLVKLNYEIGEGLLLDGSLTDNFSEVIEIGPGRDTTIKHTVFNRTKETESELYSTMFSRITIKAEVDTLVQSRTLYYRNIPNELWNKYPYNKSPLNVGLLFTNLIGENLPGIRLTLDGNILTKDKGKLGYSFLLNNPYIFRYLPPADYVFWNLIRMTFNYNYKNTGIVFGDSYRLPSGGYGVGRGLILTQAYKFGTYDVGIFRNWFQNSYSVAGGIKLAPMGKIPSITLNNSWFSKTNLFNSRNIFNIKAGIPMPKNHSLSLGIGSANTSYILNANPDSLNKVFNLLYNVGYKFAMKKFDIALNYNDFIPASGLSWGKQTRAGILASYQLPNSNKIKFQGNYIDYSLNSDFFDFNEPWLNSTPIRYAQRSNYRLIYFGRTKSGYSYNIGPSYENFENFSDSPKDWTYTLFKSNSYRVISRLNYPFGKDQSISPFLNIGYTRINNIISQYYTGYYYVFGSKPLLNFSTGANYRKKMFNLNVNYILGPYFSYSQMDLLDDFRTSKQIRITPGYRKTWMMQRTQIYWSIYGIYQWNVPGNIERITASSDFNASFNNGWSAGIGGYMYVFNRQDEESRIGTKNYGLNLGVKKSFAFNQPAFKFYDVTFICFKDLNGNGTMDDNERPLSDVYINIASRSNRRAEFELMTNAEGTCKYHKLVQGLYDLEILPLTEIGDLYCVNGENQRLVLDKNVTYYVPFSPTYKVSGKINLIRDPFSIDVVSPADIRIMAISMEDPRKRYFTLTDGNGEYILNVPSSGFYKLRINNILGSNFELEQEEFILDFDGMREFVVDFNFKESKRKINFNSGGVNYNFNFNFNSDDLDESSSEGRNFFRAPEEDKAEEETKSTVVNSIIKDGFDKTHISFKIQIGVFDEIPAEFEQRISSLEDVEIVETDEGLSRISMGKTKTIGDIMSIRNEMIDNGWNSNDLIIIGDYEGRYLTIDEVKLLLNR